MSADSATNEADWTLGRLLSWTSDYLCKRDVAEPRLAAEVLLAHAATCRRIDLYTRFEEVLPAERLDRFRSWVSRAAKHEPIAYLVGYKEFFSLSMVVTPEVLIPRPETETLVECVIDHCRAAGLSEPFLLDLGTGSGCIVVALLSQLKSARAVATDVSPAALEVARRNAQRHGVSDRLELIEADLLAIPEAAVPPGGFDVLLCNPPYVAVGELERLDRTVREYEPRIALTDEANGLSFFRAIGVDGPALLGPRGSVFVETGDGQASAVIETITVSGRLTHKGTWKDRTVGQDRVVMFSLR